MELNNQKEKLGHALQVVLREYEEAETRIKKQIIEKLISTGETLTEEEKCHRKWVRAMLSFVLDDRNQANHREVDLKRVQFVLENMGQEDETKLYAYYYEKDQRFEVATRVASTVLNLDRSVNKNSFRDIWTFNAVLSLVLAEVLYEDAKPFIAKYDEFEWDEESE